MPRQYMRLTGLDATVKALRNLPDELEADAVTEALIDAAVPMADDAAARARKARGKLAESIIVTDGVAPSLRGKVPKKTGTRAVAFVGPNIRRGAEVPWAPHGYLVELGTKPRRQKSGRYTGRMPPFPFMRPAFDAEGVPTIRRFQPELWKQVQKAVSAVVRKYRSLQGTGK